MVDYSNYIKEFQNIFNKTLLMCEEINGVTTDLALGSFQELLRNRAYETNVLKERFSSTRTYADTLAKNFDEIESPLWRLKFYISIMNDTINSITTEELVKILMLIKENKK
uniref:Uncharacterized protein n=1 Tax=Strongyloides stercoralis TaxID=6248 RepID=A0A0K0ELN1_STRER